MTHPSVLGLQSVIRHTEVRSTNRRDLVKREGIFVPVLKEKKSSNHPSFLGFYTETEGVIGVGEGFPSSTLPTTLLHDPPPPMGLDRGLVSRCRRLLSTPLETRTGFVPLLPVRPFSGDREETVGRDDCRRLRSPGSRGLVRPSPPHLPHPPDRPQ